MERQKQTICALILAFIPVAEIAYARCSGAIAFNNIKQIYRDTLLETGQRQRHAAKALAFSVGGQSAQVLARQIGASGVEVDTVRLDAVLKDAMQLAEQSLSESRTREPDFSHSENLRWMTEVYVASRCHKSKDHAVRPAPAFAPSGSTDDNLPQPQTPRDTKREFTMLLVIVAFLLGTVIGGNYLWTLFKSRKKTVERAHRSTIEMQVDVAWTDDEGEMREMQLDTTNISTSGIGLLWTDPPAKGTLVTLNLLEVKRMATVAWSGQNSVGLKFETPMFNTDINRLKEGA